MPWRSITAASRATLARMTNGFFDASGSVTCRAPARSSSRTIGPPAEATTALPAVRDQRRGKIDRAALDAAGDEPRQHLQHGARAGFRAGSPR